MLWHFDAEYGKKVVVVILTNLNPDEKIMGHVFKDEPAYYLEKKDWTLQDVVEKVKTSLKVSPR